MTITLEICVDDVEGLDRAIAGGADRIELCSALAVGGLTPSAGLMAAAAQRAVPAYVMIRPRAGSFVFSPAEVDQMLVEIDYVRSAGLAGVVLGASDTDGHLDAQVLERLVRRADGLGLTLHRAFDLVPDFAQAVNLAVSLGFERILTSGGAGTAIAGLDALKQIVSHAGQRIAIMPGSGVTATNAAEIVTRLGICEIHASGSTQRMADDLRLAELGFMPATFKTTDTQAVAALKVILSELSTGQASAP